MIEGYRAASDCNRCGCCWDIDVMLPEELAGVEFEAGAVVYSCCPACGWLAKDHLAGVGKHPHRGEIIFDAQDPAQIAATL